MSIKKLNETDALAFDAPPSEDTELTNYEWKPPTDSGNKNYDNLPANVKRLQILWDIKTGDLNAADYPAILLKLSKFIKKKEDGTLVIANSEDKGSSLGRLYPKVINFVMSGKSGLETAPNNPELIRIGDRIIAELLTQLHGSHAKRKLESLDKQGKLDEVINFYLQKHHYDLFNIPWLKDVIKLLALRRVKDEKRGKFDEAVFLEEIQHILSEYGADQWN